MLLRRVILGLVAVGLVLVGNISATSINQKWPTEIPDRRRVLLFPPAIDRMLGILFLSKVTLEESEINDRNQMVVKSLGTRLARVADREFGLCFDWNFQIVQNPLKNAFCLQGGKVVVYSGLVNHLVKGEMKGRYKSAKSVLAFIIAHEIGHAVARHHAERMSVAVPAVAATWIPQFLMQQHRRPGAQLVWASQARRALTSSVAWCSKHVALLRTAGFLALMHWSRRDEHEADCIGVLLALKAGFEVEEGLQFFDPPRENKLGRGKFTHAVSRTARVILWPVATLRRITSTHPQEEERLRRALEMLRVMDVNNANTRLPQLQLLQLGSMPNGDGEEQELILIKEEGFVSHIVRFLLQIL